jgi:membrane peptidoglycan carboxypeptidase
MNPTSRNHQQKREQRWHGTHAPVYRTPRLNCWTLRHHPIGGYSRVLRVAAIVVDRDPEAVHDNLVHGRPACRGGKCELQATEVRRDRTWRQPGSTFKIFTYGSLIERLTREVLAAKPPPQTVEEISAGVLRRCTVLDAPIYVSLGRGRGAKKIESFHSRSEPEYRGDITCRIALDESRNTAAMRAGARAGIKKVIDLTYRLGLPRDAKHILQPYPTTAIGASEVKPLSMRSAAAFRERWISSDAAIRK